jgi:hypothetical protein
LKCSTVFTIYSYNVLQLNWYFISESYSIMLLRTVLFCS